MCYKQHGCFKQTVILPFLYSYNLDQLSLKILPNFDPNCTELTNFQKIVYRILLSSEKSESIACTVDAESLVI